MSQAQATTRPQQAGEFTTHDGQTLFYRYWPTESAQPKGAIALFHRGHEHSGRMAHLVDELKLPDFAFFAWDARGHGQSPGERGYSPSLGASVRDVQCFIAHLHSAHGFSQEDIAVIAQSVGAVLVATWVHDYAPNIRCQVLASPAFEVKLYVPLAVPGLRLMQAMRGNFYVNSYVKAKLLTHDPARIDSFQRDPAIAKAISVNILLQLHDTAKRVVADAGAITTPTQLLISGSDWVVQHGPQHRFYENLGSGIKERHILDGFFHDTLGEKDRGPVVAEVRRFLLERFADTQTRPSLVDADQSGFTRNEVDRLQSPLPLLSPRGIYWAMNRLGLRLGGRFSHGIRLGQDTGFDSGSTLDYVYRNRDEGTNALGRFIDHGYLNSVGWRGIRQRKLHVEELMRVAMTRLRDESLPVRVLDIAAGHGRYVLDALTSASVQPESVHLRDYSTINVEAGSQLIRERRLEEIARFEVGDAFDTESLAAITPQPTLGIVSGLYELFPDNAMLRRSLAGLEAAIVDGGYLIYTCQPWHPQLEFIARVLTSHRGGDAWVMRRRTQAEMDQLVAAAGFEKIDQRIDEWGIFTVSLARKRPL